MSLSNILNYTQPAVYPHSEISNSKNLKYEINKTMIHLRGLIAGTALALLAPATILTPCTFIATFLGVSYLEKRRAYKVLDQKIVERLFLLSTGKPIGHRAFNYLASHPSTLQQLSKNRRYGKTIFKLENKDRKKLITSLLSDNIFRSAVDNDRVKSEDFSFEQICALWIQAAENYQYRTDTSVGPLLMKKGFDVNSVDSEGYTLFERVLVDFNLKDRQLGIPNTMIDSSPLIIFLLAHGAKLPDLTKKLPTGTPNTNPQSTIGEFLNDSFFYTAQIKPIIDYYTKEASKTKEQMPPEGFTSPDIKPAFWNLRAPAIHIDGRSGKFQTKASRLLAVPLMAGVLAGVTLALAIPTVTSIAIPIIIAVGTQLLVYKFESKRAHAALSKKALELYQHIFPWTQVFKYILCDPEGEFLKKLIKENADLRKFDSHGKKLWTMALSASFSHKPSFKTLCTLADGLFQQTENGLSEEQFYDFLEAIEANRTDIVNYLLNEKVDPRKMTEQQQYLCWSAFQLSSSRVQLLVEKGFNINAAYATGETILVSSIVRVMGKEVDADLFAKLLELGANPDTRFTVHIQGTLHSNITIDGLLDLIPNQLKANELKSILTNHREKQLKA